MQGLQILNKCVYFYYLGLNNDEETAITDTNRQDAYVERLNETDLRCRTSPTNRPTLSSVSSCRTPTSLPTLSPRLQYDSGYGFSSYSDDNVLSPAPSSVIEKETILADHPEDYAVNTGSSSTSNNDDPAPQFFNNSAYLFPAATTAAAGTTNHNQPPVYRKGSVESFSSLEGSTIGAPTDTDSILFSPGI